MLISCLNCSTTTTCAAGLLHVTSLRGGGWHIANVKFLGRYSAGACWVFSCWASEWNSSLKLDLDSISHHGSKWGKMWSHMWAFSGTFGVEKLPWHFHSPCPDPILHFLLYMQRNFWENYLFSTTLLHLVRNGKTSYSVRMTQCHKQKWSMHWISTVRDLTC